MLLTSFLLRLITLAYLLFYKLVYYTIRSSKKQVFFENCQSLCRIIAKAFRCLALFTVNATIIDKFSKFFIESNHYFRLSVAMKPKSFYNY